VAPSFRGRAQVNEVEESLMVVAAAWLHANWIYSELPEQNGKYWIDNNWIWGPDGAADMTTGYWITAGWILGPDGAKDARTGYYIADGWIWGPEQKLPWV
jgi:hypothetical protein